VDAGGVKKLVLGTVSSPSGSDEEDDNENAVVSAAANGRVAQADGEGAIEDGEADGDAKKRRRKRGKKKGGEENQPLLSGS